MVLVFLVTALVLVFLVTALALVFLVAVGALAGDLAVSLGLAPPKVKAEVERLPLLSSVEPPVHLSVPRLRCSWVQAQTSGMFEPITQAVRHPSLNACSLILYCDDSGRK